MVARVRSTTKTPSLPPADVTTELAPISSRAATHSFGDTPTGGQLSTIPTSTIQNGGVEEVNGSPEGVRLRASDDLISAAAERLEVLKTRLQVHRNGNPRNLVPRQDVDCYVIAM